MTAFLFKAFFLLVPTCMMIYQLRNIFVRSRTIPSEFKLFFIAWQSVGLIGIAGFALFFIFTNTLFLLCIPISIIVLGTLAILFAPIVPKMQSEVMRDMIPGFPLNELYLKFPTALVKLLGIGFIIGGLAFIYIILQST